MSQNRKSNLEDANLDNKSSTINLEDKNLNEQYDLLAVLNVPQKEPYVERTKWQSFKNFVNFLVFDVKWFMVFYHSFLFLGFLYSAITSIYILLFLPLTDEWLRMLLTWFFGKCIDFDLFSTHLCSSTFLRIFLINFFNLFKKNCYKNLTFV